jgi:DNA polymerase alpha subunit A
MIVGHNLQGYTLDVLLSRMDNFKMGGTWSRITRLRRSMLAPINQGEGWNEYRLDDLSNGRLFCDTFVAAKELLTSQSTYSLSHLVSTQLQKKRIDVEMTDLPSILSSGPENFVKLLRHTLDDAMFILQLMHKLEVLPLSKQLSNLCGYLWSRTLQANKRAERIEYLLLHEFDKSKHKFIVPEKSSIKSSSNKKREAAGYAGGMVFAPKKGLYDHFVVLLDFNSLYPSIIREYNICFTTVERNLEASKTTASSSVDNFHDEDDAEQMLLRADQEVPALPSASSAEGVLPQVMKRLLESRKQVKQQLKAELIAGNIEKSKKLDIRQKAIKLTANSMYGCLGFRYSRFYAKPIAALITSTGRQTLQRAQEVAEQECGYDVIYGDTDSIMVDSKSDRLEDAKRIGREIQVQCNKHFKLLELEVDYIFKTILLLNKKKYASLVVKERSDGELVRRLTIQPIF